jgi:hypothetical protein
MPQPRYYPCSGVTRRRWFLPDHQHLMGHAGPERSFIMTAELKKSVDKLRSLSPQLNAAAEQASRVVQLVETFLNDECKAGMPCSVTVWTKMPDHEQYATVDDFEGLLLGYDRVGGKFRIVVQSNTKELNHETEKDEITVNVTPWSDSPKAEKLKSFARLPMLLENIASEIEYSIKSTGETAATIDQIMGALGERGDKIVDKTLETVESARRLVAIAPNMRAGEREPIGRLKAPDETLVATRKK